MRSRARQCGRIITTTMKRGAAVTLKNALRRSRRALINTSQASRRANSQNVSRRCTVQESRINDFQTANYALRREALQVARRRLLWFGCGRARESSQLRTAPE